MLRALRLTLKTGIFSLPFVPLLVAPSLLFPYVTGKGFAFRMITEVVFAAWLLLALADRTYRPRASALLWVLFAFVGVVGIANLLGVDPASSFWGGLPRMDGYLALLHWLAFFLVLGSLVATKGLGDRFLATTVVASSAVCLYSLVELAQNLAAGQPRQRLQATLGNPTFLGGYVMLQLFVLVFLAVRRGAGESRFWGWPARLLIGLHLAVLFLTGTRGAVLGLVVGAVVAILIVAALERRGESSRASAREAVGALLIVLIGFFLFEASDYLRGWAGQTLGRSDGRISQESETDHVPGAMDPATGEVAPSVPSSPSDLDEQPLAGEGLASSLVQSVSAPLQRLARIGSGGSVQIRLALWETAQKGFWDRPLTGWGQENFDVVADRHFLASFPSEEEWVDRPHNTVLEWLVSGGVAAGILYVAIFVAAGWLLWSPAATIDLSITQKSVLTGLLCAYFVSNLFLFDMVPSYLALFSVLAYLHALATRGRPAAIDERVPGSLARSREERDARDGLGALEESPGVGKPVLLTVAVLLICSTGWALYQLNVRPILAARAGRRAAALVAVDPEASLAEFRRALGYGTFAVSAVRERLVLAAVDPRVAGAPGNLASEFAELAEEEWNEELRAQPERSRAHAFLGVLLQETGEPERAATHLARAITLSPTRRGHCFRLADLYQRNGQAEAALEWAARGFNLDPSRRRSRLRYAAAAVYAGRDDLVEDLLVPVYGGTLVRNEQLSRAYISVGREQELVEAWRELIRGDPQDLDARRSLVDLLFLAGRTEEAATELRTLQILSGLAAR